jgi:hypothetical protein
MGEKPKRPALLMTCTLIVLLVLTVLVAGCLANLVTGYLSIRPFPSAAPSPVEWIGAAVCTLPMIAFGFGVFRSVFSLSLRATRVVTVFYFAGAGLIVFGVVATYGGAVVRSPGPDWRLYCAFATIGLAIAGFLGLCGILSLRWGRQLLTYYVALRTEAPQLAREKRG